MGSHKLTELHESANIFSNHSFANDFPDQVSNYKWSYTFPTTSAPTLSPITTAPTPLPTLSPTAAPLNTTGRGEPPGTGALKDVINNPAAIGAAGAAMGIVILAALVVGIRSTRQKRITRKYGLDEKIQTRIDDDDDDSSAFYMENQPETSTSSMSFYYTHSPFGAFSTSEERAIHTIPEEPESEAEAEM